MMKTEFTPGQTTERLTIMRSRKGCFFELLVLGFIITITASVCLFLLFSDNFKYKEFSVILLAALVAMILRMKNKIYTYRNPAKLIFDKVDGTFKINEIEKVKLDDIIHIEMNYNSDSRFLELKTKNGLLLIEEGDANNEELMDNAYRIAYFLNLRLKDSHPYEEKLKRYSVR